MNFDFLYKDKKIFALIIIAVILGIVLLSSDNKVSEIKEEKVIENSDLEKDLENILSKVKGAGRVSVMITYKSGDEKIIAYNTDNQNEKREEGFSANEKKEIALAENSPVILKEVKPEIEGVLIVCEGGGDINVKNNLIRASMALLNVDVNKIEVLIMKKEN
ncbi:MAG: hypothetical protein ACI4VF_08160 [Lachnospirales bacterium]